MLDRLIHMERNRRHGSEIADGDAELHRFSPVPPRPSEQGERQRQQDQRGCRFATDSLERWV
jgi:hypothetical protein